MFVLILKSFKLIKLIGFGFLKYPFHYNFAIFFLLLKQGVVKTLRCSFYCNLRVCIILNIKVFVKIIYYYLEMLKPISKKSFWKSHSNFNSVLKGVYKYSNWQLFDKETMPTYKLGIVSLSESRQLEYFRI